MNTKLTLKLNKQVIERAKAYAAGQQKSLSGIIEAYLMALTEGVQKSENDIEISPFVKSLKTGVKVPAHFDHKEVYRDHMDKKHR